MIGIGKQDTGKHEAGKARAAKVNNQVMQNFQSDANITQVNKSGTVNKKTDNLYTHQATQTALNNIPSDAQNAR